MNKTCKIRVSGLVQGIGFRPFVAELAEALGLAGQVKNLGGIVEVIVSGDRKAVDTFIQRLSYAGGYVEGISVGALESTQFVILPGCRLDGFQIENENHDMIYKTDVLDERFHIVESGTGRESRRFLPVDLPTCDRCIEEMHDRNNRRYRYPFISCTSCGPRFSIQKEVPYDRETITMDDFPMCDACKEEYTKKGNIRRHAQTIACKDCGPKLKFVATEDAVDWMKCEDYKKLENRERLQDFLQISDEQKAISEAVQALKKDKIGAIKDIGGYHFAFSPFSSRAARALREFKHRDKKPFAVMFLNLDEVRAYCEVSEKEAAILTSSARPIVLLKKKKDFVPEICGESDRIGAILPCNPLQILLLEETGPLVMTSGNRGGEPIIISESEMKQYIGNGIDFMLTHDREILTPLDDSIYQVAETGHVQLIRRARGLAPEPICLHRKLSRDTFAAGGDLKAVFGLGRENMVYLSQYYGDLEDVRCAESREKGIHHLSELLEIKLERSVGDLHPAYFSSQNMEKKVQHHHAHIASVIAEHDLTGKVLGIACDGTGYGTDGTIWGSEFLLCENEKMSRVGHFSSVKLIGGDASAKQADLTLYSYMLEARERGLDVAAFFTDCESACVDEQGNPDVAASQKLKLQEMAWKQNINAVRSSSMGRLFDAAAALLGICTGNSYEGECAITLEQMAHQGRKKVEKLESTCYKDTQIETLDGWHDLLNVQFAKNDEVWQADSVKLLVDLYHLKQKYSKEVLAYFFHHAVARAIVDIADVICKEQDISQVALSGGTFINRILLKEVVDELLKREKEVYINEKVSSGDGGIALGQMYIMTYC
ncbi:MAG: carbamoyltransferase HypF [Agathobacter sp.]|nr:carbamoyltransferase HypF [Agathobacter sp.]